MNIFRSSVVEGGVFDEVCCVVLPKTSVASNSAQRKWAQDGGLAENFVAVLFYAGSIMVLQADAHLASIPCERNVIMWWHGPWEWWMPMMWIFPLIFLVVVLVFVFRGAGCAVRGAPDMREHNESASEILDRRYASGEISRDDYQRMKQDIKSGPGAA